jgi:type II secretory pathway pseudopilin PulG
MTKPIPTRRPRPSEGGYMLVAVMFMLAILIISLAIAAPAVKTELLRDREIETMHRGKQYVRGIQLYYKKFGRYPANVDALVKPTNGIRFLRKKYIDPTTGKDEWRPIQLGQNKAPTAMGFFGQAMGATGTGQTGVTGASNLGSPLGSSSGFGSSSSGFGTSSSGIGSSSIGAGSDAANLTGTAGATGTSSDSSGGTSASGTSTTTGSSSGSSAFGGQTFGGAGIMGFAPTSPKHSLLVYKKKNHYNEWEFVYDPLTELKTVGSSSGPSGGQSASSISTGIGATPTTPTSSPSSGTSLTPTQ